MIPFEAIIKGETNDSRFEKFCRGTVAEKRGYNSGVNFGGLTILAETGFAIRPTKGTHAEVLCCTIDKDIENKVIRDAEKIGVYNGSRARLLLLLRAVN